ncbi:hypothetical protein [Sphingomonas montana]|uniref:hypothetical protein n=1 Tax=Sphingomonas montana TaxID=1843236 RepID=UPI00096EEE6B|nr:hypothetical protein [Sphingomonas montana]
MRVRYIILAALAVVGCKREPDTPPIVRPDWRGAAIEGIAPLMSTRQVQAALDRGGYRQIPCTSTDSLLADPLNEPHALPCYQASGRTMSVSLYFLNLHEGRRLAVANFRERASSDMVDGERIAAGRAYAARLRKRFGPPSYITNQPSFRIIYWNRPGGQPSLPDTIRTDIDHYQGANATLTSMWAYGQVPASQ